MCATYEQLNDQSCNIYFIGFTKTPKSTIIQPELKDELCDFICKIGANYRIEILEFYLYDAGDGIHILCKTPLDLDIGEFLEIIVVIKQKSCDWIRGKSPSYKRFRWRKRLLCFLFQPKEDVPF